ncbi:hypothetical protein WA1_23965 [Scytonema hofmannii PCC 7110]|uniref:Uncharacterized protein n=1 Tax=Scytonema hofmannii PCC 7110 TaxID=128403 RepID=A0A139X7P1_9CYAN|nr:hypothetical protein [Scytonema hofmannii]KYC40700.1 hypothetical protein WA1_23965 [Scytonema hofmannii PCC 7110]
MTARKIVTLELEVKYVNQKLANIFLPGSQNPIGIIFQNSNEIGFEFNDDFSNLEPKFPKTLILPDLGELSQGFLGLRGLELWKSVFIPAILEVSEKSISITDRKLWITC